MATEAAGAAGASLTAISLQGRAGSNQWVKGFKLDYSQVLSPRSLLQF